MAITKPYTFVAGQKARANEVNADFDTLYSQVNSNITAIANNASDIDTLENTKANLNGSASQRFAVNDPVSNADAVNKQTMGKAITPLFDYISGLTITKDSGSPNDTILISTGSCYDSTKSVVLKLDNSTTKQNLSQGASTTYYVYIIGNDTGSSIDILISSNQVTPTLPSGYTKYRQIGYYTTDSSSHIDSVSYYGIDSYADNSGIWKKAFPSNTYKELSWVGNTQYTAPADGWFELSATHKEGGIRLTVDRIGLGSSSYNNSGTQLTSRIHVPVRKGQTVTTFNDYGTTTIQHFRFIYAQGEV